MPFGEDVLRIQRSGLRLRQLRMLQVLAEAGSVHAAADQLGLSQPAVTKSLQELESIFGVTLFQRSALGIVPTEPCKPILRFAADVASNLEAAVAALDRLLTGDAEAVMIGTCGGRAAELIGAAMELHAQHHARVRVDILEREPGRLIAAVLSGRVQWAIGFRPAELTEQLDFESLQSERYVVVARPGHRLLSSGQASVAELATQPWVLHQPPASVHETWQGVFASVQAPPPPVAVIAGSLASFAALIRQFDGVGVIDATSARLLPGMQPYDHPYFATLWSVLGILRSHQHRLTPGAATLLERVRTVSRLATMQSRTTGLGAA